MSCLGMRWRGCLAGLGIVMCVAACRTQPPPPSKTERLHLRLHAGADSNGARPVYYALRAVADESAFAEGYEAALNHALESDPEANIVAQGLLRPQTTLDKELTIPRDHELLLYVFFTSREGLWKLHLQRASTVSLVVGAKTIQQQSKAKP